MAETLLQPSAEERRASSTTYHSSFHPTDSSPKRRNSYEILGIQGALFVAFGSAAIGVTLGFLVFLWYSDESNSLWKRVMLANWGVRSVTITTVLTRWVVVTQATFATSMLAALILHRPKVALCASAPLSVMRVTNSGPWGLSYLLSMTPNLSARLGLYGLALFLTFLTTLLQFSTTILLTDFSIALIQDKPEDLVLNFGWNTTTLTDELGTHTNLYESLWQNRPAFYPTFAEHVNATPVLKDGVYDSGIILRAYFPISSASTRSSLQNFTGVASVLGSRVICARPEYYDLNITYDNYGLEIQISTGTNITDENEELGSFSIDTESWQLNCSLPVAGDAGSYPPEWNLSLCYQKISPDRNWNPTGSSTWGEGFVVFNITGDADIWYELGPKNLDLWNRSAHGEWATLTRADSNGTAQLDLSICTTEYYQSNRYISAISTSNRTEPSLSWDFRQQKFDTLAIRRQLGATSEQLSIDDRGIFSLQWPDNLPVPISIANITLGAIAMGFVQSWEGDDSSLINSSIPFCQYCTSSGPDEAQSAIFQDTLTQTSHPATALQAYGTLQYSMFYYMAALQFNVQAPASFTSFVLRIQPTTDRGFILYTIIVVLYLALILFITGLFLSTKRHTMLNNSWQAIAQMVSPETASILEFADKATDSEVNEWIKKKGKDDDSFHITENDGGIRLRRCAD